MLGALACALISGVVMSLPAAAQSDDEIGYRGNFKPTAEELSLLPDYCRARARPNNHPHARRWASMMGDAWIHIHHYCIALQHMNDVRFKGVSMSQRERDRALRRVVGEINYVEQRVDPGFPLWGEMQAYKNQAQSQLTASGARR